MVQSVYILAGKKIKALMKSFNCIIHSSCSLSVFEKLCRSGETHGHPFNRIKTYFLLTVVCKAN